MVMKEKTVEEVLKEIEFCYELHDFQMKRLSRLIGAVKSKFGDEVLETVKNVDVNYTQLIRWYLNRTVSILDTLKDKFGEEVVEIVKQSEVQDRLRGGKDYAKMMGCNKLEGVIPMFKEENIVSKTDMEILFRQNNGCPISRIAREDGITNWMYILACYTDPHLVEGYNEKLCCEVRKSHMCGDDYCEWLIYDKELKEL